MSETIVHLVQFCLSVMGVLKSTPKRIMYLIPQRTSYWEKFLGWLSKELGNWDSLSQYLSSFRRTVSVLGFDGDLHKSVFQKKMLLDAFTKRVFNSAFYIIREWNPFQELSKMVGVIGV